MCHSAFLPSFLLANKTKKNMDKNCRHSFSWVFQVISAMPCFASVFDFHHSIIKYLHVGVQSSQLSIFPYFTHPIVGKERLLVHLNIVIRW